MTLAGEAQPGSRRGERCRNSVNMTASLSTDGGYTGFDVRCVSKLGNPDAVGESRRETMQVER